MPSWEPNWEDVRWNWATSDATRGALMRMAQWLDDDASYRQQQAHALLVQWEGRKAREFDEMFKRAVGELRAMAERCRHGARSIERAASAAREEQARREAERTRWYAERAEELREKAAAAWRTISGQRD